MKKTVSFIVGALLALSLFAGCAQGASSGTVSQPDSSAAQSGEEKLVVYASFYPVYDFAKNIGKDRIELINMVPAGTEPHDWEPAPTDIVGLENAQVFIYNGAGMEHWVDSVLSGLSNQDLLVVEASKGIELMEGHTHEEDEHEGEEAAEEEEAMDPHVWLNPQYAKVEAENIKNALVQADPDNAEYYEANYTEYAAKLDALDQKMEEALNPLENKTIVVAHEAFGYLCARYGLTQVGIEGLSPDSEPDAARMAEIIEFVKTNDVKVIFFEELVSPKVAETIADETGSATDVLNPLEGLSEDDIAAGQDYITVMEKNLDALLNALA